MKMKKWNPLSCQCEIWYLNPQLTYLRNRTLPLSNSASTTRIWGKMWEQSINKIRNLKTNMDRIQAFISRFTLHKVYSGRIAIYMRRRVRQHLKETLVLIPQNREADDESKLWVEDFLRLWDSLDEDFDYICHLIRGRLLLSIHPSLDEVFGVTVKTE